MWHICRFLIVCTLSAYSPFLRSETIVIRGSDTLGAKMVPQLSEAFKSKLQRYGREVVFEIAAEGSATGVAATINGDTSIGLLSRRPSPTESAKARARGVEIGMVTVARDSIAVIINRENPLTSLRLEQIESIFTSEIRNWAAVSDKPGEISAYTRNTASGTYRAFQELAMQARDYGETTLKMASNEQIAEQVADNPNGIGYVGLAYIDTPGVKVLTVDGASPTDIAAYPLSRPLYFSFDKNSPLDEAANDFIGFTLSPVGQRIVSNAHFVPLY